MGSLSCPHPHTGALGAAGRICRRERAAGCRGIEGAGGGDVRAPLQGLSHAGTCGRLHDNGAQWLYGKRYGVCTESLRAAQGGCLPQGAPACLWSPCCAVMCQYNPIRPRAPLHPATRTLPPTPCPAPYHTSSLGFNCSFGNQPR